MHGGVSVECQKTQEFVLHTFNSIANLLEYSGDQMQESNIKIGKTMIFYRWMILRRILERSGGKILKSQAFKRQLILSDQDGYQNLIYHCKLWWKYDRFSLEIRVVQVIIVVDEDVACLERNYVDLDTLKSRWFSLAQMLRAARSFCKNSQSESLFIALKILMSSAYSKMWQLVTTWQISFMNKMNKIGPRWLNDYLV